MAGVSGSYEFKDVTVQFPNTPYQSQFSMMNRVLEGIKTSKNCLLDSPTGSGKSLALLCSALAWQKKETERVAAMSPVKGAASPSKNVGTPTRMTQRPPGNGVMSPTGSAGGFLSPSQQRLYNDPELADFKRPSKRFKLPSTETGVDSDELVVIYPKGPPSNPYHQQLPGTGPQVVLHGSPEKPANCRPRVPRIYFGTRTHKQIEQLVRELSKTEYKDVRMTILSSREQTCNNPKFKSGLYKSKTEMCHLLLDPIEGMGCSYKNNVQHMAYHDMLTSNGCPQPWDIEDLVRVGNRTRTCPYFTSRSLISASQIIFCPYNYLIDPKITRSMKLDLRGEVVILDEAHNIEDVSRESASLDLGMEDVAAAIKDLKGVAGAGYLRDSHNHLSFFLTKLQQLVEEQKDSLKNQDFNNFFTYWSGTEAVAQFDEAGIGLSDYPQFKEEVSGVLASMSQLTRESSIHTMSAVTKNLMENLVQTMDFIYSNEMRHRDDYYVAITRSLLSGNRKPPAKDSFGYLNASQQAPENRWVMQLSFWCQNPAVVFQGLASVARTIVLTSGTLAPIDSFQSELGTNFNIILEASHVIDPSQVFVGSIKNGPTGRRLDGTFHSTSTFEYQDEVGRIVLDVCSTVPHGVLCFLPSYSLMERLVSRWIISGLMDQMKQVKLVLTEPRRGGLDMERTMQQFYEAIARSEGPQDGEDRRTGSLFLAVMRGKVSEGLDFADNNARIVITVGIPYPNKNDIHVKLKMKYNDENRKRDLLIGSRWLNIQAFRAMNQALGRCIRHRNDWGAILMVDERFSSSDRKYTNSLPKWIRERKLTHFTQWDQVIQGLSAFVKMHSEKTLPPSVPYREETHVPNEAGDAPEARTQEVTDLLTDFEDDWLLPWSADSRI